MSLKQHVWVWKTLAKISALGFVFIFVLVFVGKFGTIFNLDFINSDNAHYIVIAVLSPLFVGFILYSKFVKKVTPNVITDPKMVSRVLVKIGGALKGGTSMSKESLEKDAISYLKEKYTNLEDLVRDGEYAFESKAGNDFDFLFEFLEIYDLSGKRVQTLTIKKGSKEQMDFVSKIPKGIRLEWKVERVNRGFD